MAFVAALTGVLTGEVGRWITRLIDMREAKNEHARKIEMLRLAHANEIDLKEMDNIGKALQSVPTDTIKLGDNLNPWVLNGATALQVVVRCSSEAVRPLATAGAVYILARAFAGSDAAMRAAITEEVVFTCAAVIRFWFGYREDKRRREK